MMSLDRTFTGILEIVLGCIFAILVLNGVHVAAQQKEKYLFTCSYGTNRNQRFDLECSDGLIHLTTAQVRERVCSPCTWTTCSPSLEFVRNAMGMKSLTRKVKNNEFEPNTCKSTCSIFYSCRRCIRYRFKCAMPRETINMRELNTNSFNEGYIAVETKLSAGDRYSCMLSSDRDSFNLTLLSLRFPNPAMLHIDILQTGYPNRRQFNITQTLFHFPNYQEESQNRTTVYWYLKKVELTLTGIGNSFVFINFKGATSNDKVNVQCNSPTTTTTTFTTTSTTTALTTSQTIPTSPLISITIPSEQASEPSVDSTLTSFAPHTTSTSQFINAEQASDDGSNKQAAVIGGGVGGAVLFLVAIVLLIVLLLKRRGTLPSSKAKKAESKSHAATALDNFGAHECPPVPTHRGDGRPPAHNQYKMTRLRDAVGVDNNLYEETYSKQYTAPRGKDQQLYDSADYACYDYAVVPPSKQRSSQASALSRSTTDGSKSVPIEAEAPRGVLTESNDLYEGEEQMHIQQNDLYEGDANRAVQQNDLYEGCEKMTLDESAKYLPASLDIQQNDLYGSD